MGCICISTQNPHRSQSDIFTNGKILAYFQAHLIMMLPTTLSNLGCTPLHEPSSERLQLKILWNKSRMLFTSDSHCPIYLRICAYITINQIITVTHFSLQIHFKYANSGYFRLKSESLVLKVQSLRGWVACFTLTAYSHKAIALHSTRLICNAVAPRLFD